MSLKSDLVAAKALIADPAKWIKGSLESDGCYCALGAADHIVGGVNQNTIKAAHYVALRNAIPPDFEPDESDWNSDVAQFNDAAATTHADIMALFDRAINAASIASLDAAIAECAKPLPRHA